MSLSRREQLLGTVTLLALLFGSLGMTARKRLEVIRDKADYVAALTRTNASERTLIELGPQWHERYNQVRDQMPVFEPGRQVDTYWLSRMDTLATQYGVQILRRQVGREELVGDVYEFSIECREWEGTLDAFVRFMFAMQTEGAMLDVRDLLIRPHPASASLMRGSFVLYCAYMRGTPVAVGDKPAVSATPPARPGRIPAEADEQTTEPSSNAEMPAEAGQEAPSDQPDQPELPDPPAPSDTNAGADKADQPEPVPTTSGDSP